MVETTANSNPREERKQGDPMQGESGGPTLFQMMNGGKGGGNAGASMNNKSIADKRQDFELTRDAARSGGNKDF